MFLEVLDDAGLAADALIAGLPLTLDELRNPNARIDWNLFAELLARLERLCGDALPPEEIGRRIVGMPSFHFLRRVGRLVMSPKRLYEIGFRLVTPSLFANVSVRTEWLETGRVVIRGEIAEGYRESNTFFRICAGNVASASTVLELPPATIEEQVFLGRRWRLVLFPPPSQGFGRRILRGVRGLGAVADGWRGVVRQQREIEESLATLRTSRHELQQLLERLPDGVLIQRNGVVRWANAALLEILGVQRLEDVVGHAIIDLMPPEDREGVLLAIRQAATSEVSHGRHEYRVLRRDGTLRRVQSATAQVVNFEGEPARLVVLRDVTEQHRLREQTAIAERLASIGALAAGVAHEINNPLTYVRLSLEVASREAAKLGVAEGDSELGASLRRASEGTDRVLGITRDMKMLSRANDDLPEPVDLPAVLDAAVALANRTIGAKAQLVRSYGPTTAALASRGKLGQVFLNLLANAADAIPDGAPHDHEIRIETRTDASGRVVVEIRDTGAGIPADVAGRVFDPFFTTKAAGAGVGLGLAICQRIVTELDGEITFESKPGATAFRVTLAAAPVAESGVTAARAILPSSRARGRVLVVDDEPSLVATMRLLLGTDHDIVTATGGRQALEILHEDHRFDAVLTDLMMADLSGMDLYETVRERYPRLERRFLFMTGGAFTSRAQQFVKATRARFIEKPFAEDELMNAIDSVIRAATS
jgi:PAS domain S-box-containing protein